MAEVNNSDVTVATYSSPPSPSSPLPPPSPPTTSFLPLLEPDTMPALMAAAFKGDGEACERALDTGADPNHSSVECRGFTPLMLAALSGQPPSSPLHSLMCIASSPVISCMTANSQVRTHRTKATHLFASVNAGIVFVLRLRATLSAPCALTCSENRLDHTQP
jgi:hypothetical protein